ncbi:MAG: rRNA pseudouridine synthase [Solobacterium sp.]|nr:rRNA pseudouridine synthase [Solobacterium sp.]
MRLDKYLSDCGLGTRKEVKKLIREGIVKVNGEVIVTSSFVFDETSEVSVEDEIIPYQKYVYIMLHKPAGYISATESREANVLDLIEEYYKGLYPVGRLDKDTEGLLLITNDGPLGHQLLSPKKHVEKEYIVQVNHPLSEMDLKQFADGIQWKDESFLPAKVFQSDTTEYHVIIQEGKFHQIKRMFQALDNEVVYLKRIRMKNLILDDSLEIGQYRFLTDEEIEDLKR